MGIWEILIFGRTWQLKIVHERITLDTLTEGLGYWIAKNTKVLDDRLEAAKLRLSLLAKPSFKRDCAATYQILNLANRTDALIIPRGILHSPMASFSWKKRQYPKIQIP